MTYVYEWDLDGSPSSFVGDYIEATYTEMGQQWTCWATPSDDEGLEGDPGYATVEIGNTAPSYSSVTLTPTTAAPIALKA